MLFPRIGMKMKPKEMADVFFSRGGIYVMDILKTGVFFPFSCLLLGWLSPSQGA